MIAHEILAVRPDWADDVTVEYLWKTVVAQAVTGSEKRSGLWAFSHRALSFQCESRSGMEAAMLRQRLQGSLGLIFGVPFWPDAVTLSADCEAGATSLPVSSTADRRFPAGGLAIAVSGSAYEVFTLDSVGATSLTLEAGIQQDWPAGTMICPFFQGRMDSTGGEITGETGESAGISIRITEEHGERLPDATADLSGFSQYLDRYVLSTPQNFDSKITSSLATSIDTLASLGETTYRLYHQTEPVVDLALAATLFSRAEIQSLLDFFNAHQGRLKTFWFPSPHADLLLSRDYDAGATIFSVQGTDGAAFFNQDFAAEGRYVVFRLPDGTLEPRQITGWSTDGYEMTVDEAIETAWPYRSVTLSFLHLVRFGKDLLSLKFQTNTVADISTEVVTIPGLEA